MKSPSRRFPAWFIAASLAVCAVGSVGVCAGQELVTSPVKDRHFPQSVFCPLPFEMTFTANGPVATIRFSTNVFYFDTNQSAILWSHQYLDNIAVAPQGTYNANLIAPGTYSSECYDGELVAQRFAFQNAGPLPFLDTFTGAPTGAWDLTHGAYFDAVKLGAPIDPGTETNRPVGALGLGQDSASPALTDSAFTSVVVSGLTNGQVYVVSGWWDVEQMQLNKIFLTGSVFGAQSTPIAHRTWGAIKREYR